jgi:hypothetical protein
MLHRASFTLKDGANRATFASFRTKMVVAAAVAAAMPPSITAQAEVVQTLGVTATNNRARFLPKASVATVQIADLVTTLVAEPGNNNNKAMRLVAEGSSSSRAMRLMAELGSNISRAMRLVAEVGAPLDSDHHLHKTAIKPPPRPLGVQPAVHLPLVNLPRTMRILAHSVSRLLQMPARLDNPAILGNPRRRPVAVKMKINVWRSLLSSIL